MFWEKTAGKDGEIGSVMDYNLGQKIRNKQPP